MNRVRTKRRRRLVLMVGVSLCCVPVGSSAGAQVVGIDDPLTEYLRLLQIQGHAVEGSFSVRPLDPAASWTPASGAHPWTVREPGSAARDGWLTLLDPRLRVHHNTRHPTGQNDGAVWRGKGFTAATDFGVSARWRGISVTVAPTLFFSQNADFALAPVSVPGMPAVAYPWRRIDLPQRFGTESYWRLDAGQTELSAEWRGLRAGVGTRNLWWGPGRRNAIVMSDNAAGFPHGFVGSSRPLDIGIGTLEARWIWGRLAQSDFFDPGVTTTDRFLTGLVAAYSPSFLPGLSVGGTRVFYGLVPDGGVPFGDYFMVFSGVRKSGLATPDNPLGDDDQDQLLSLFFRWVLAESGFEVYGEWARNDHAWDLADFVAEPEHSQAHTLGLQKGIGLGGGRTVSLWVEATRLERTRTREVRPSPVYYTHHLVVQGYTHDGQLVGAAAGPGGNQQHMGVDLYFPGGLVGVFLQRDVHDNDAYYDFARANGLDYCCHDVSLRFGPQALYFAGRWDLGASLTLTREFNRYFVGDEVYNVGLGLSATWRVR